MEFHDSYEPEPTTGCWLWTRARSKNGYGNFYNGITTVSAHRTSYEMHVGPIPEGLTIDHLCRVRACVNPLHLEPVTNAENLRRGAAARTHCANGHERSESYISASGVRICRPCRRVKERKKYARRRALA